MGPVIRDSVRHANIHGASSGVNTENLVELVTTPVGPPRAANEWSYPDFVDLRDADTGVALIGWVSGRSKTTIQTPGGVQTESVPTMFVSANYFRTLGVALARGPGSARPPSPP